MPDIITAGEILVEIMTKQKGQTFRECGELIGPFPSGAPAIFIDQAALMGANCGIISKIGNDDFGEMVLDRLFSDGVDISQVKKSKEYTTGTAFVTYIKNGSRHYIFHFKQSASGYLNPNDIDEKYLGNCKYFHIMGCSILATDSMRRAILKATKIAKRNGAMISFDPNIRSELKEIKEMRIIFDEILDMTDILLSSKNEINLMLGSCNINFEIENYLKKGVKVIAIKNGSNGVHLSYKNKKVFIESLSVEEVDPTGAGDCFDGAFLAMLAEGKSYEEAAKIANCAGALSVTKQGPMEGIHNKKKILAFLKNS